jgi:hypothetical protein
MQIAEAAKAKKLDRAPEASEMCGTVAVGIRTAKAVSCAKACNKNRIPHVPSFS